MQITSSIEPVPALDHIVEAPGRHRRNRHEPRLCLTCAAPLAGQENSCWRCAHVPEPVPRAVPDAVPAAHEPLIRHPRPAPPTSATLDGTTPLWTRHTPGAIEAGRDRRLQRRTSAPIRYRTAGRDEAVVVHADFARERWSDDGGSIDRDVSAAARVAIARS
jgi:hypothetical protein